jgi:hypothetical protein
MLNNNDEEEWERICIDDIITSRLALEGDDASYIPRVCNGNIDAPIYSPTTCITKGKYIGTEGTHNVYTAELTAIQMTVTLSEEKIDEYTKVHVMSSYTINLQHKLSTH